MSQLPMRRFRRWHLLLVVLFVLLAMSVWLLRQQAAPRSYGPKTKIVIALPTQINSGSVWVAIDRGFFGEQDVTTVVQPFALGKQALESVMQGKAELAVLADTPFMFAVMTGADIVAVSSISDSRKSMAILARRDAGIRGPADLAGKTVGTMYGTNAQFFLDTFLLANRVDNRSVRVVDVKPEAMVQVLSTGTVDAVTVWNPNLATLRRQLGDAAVTMYGGELFVYRFILVGKRDYIAAHGAEVRRALAAIEAGNRFIHEQPAQAKAIIGKVVGLDPASMANSFDPNDFSLSLDQSLLLALGDQTRWAMRRGLIQAAAVPDYLHFIDYEALEAVLPSAVKIIR